MTLGVGTRSSMLRSRHVLKVVESRLGSAGAGGVDRRGGRVGLDLSCGGTSGHDVPPLLFVG